MAYRFFRVPARGCAESEQALNSFLGNHPVLTVTRQFVDLGENSYWCFCIDCLENAPNNKAKRGRRSRVDHKELLEPDEFALYAKLRDLRKELAQSEGVPVYTVFTNEQLAQVVQSRATSKDSLQAIAGMGDARIEKYGVRVAEVATDHWNRGHEKDGKTV